MISKDLLRLNVKNMESAMNFPDMDKTQLRLSYSATNLNSIERDLKLKHLPSFEIWAEVLNLTF